MEKKNYVSPAIIVLKLEDEGSILNISDGDHEGYTRGTVISDEGDNNETEPDFD